MANGRKHETATAKRARAASVSLRQKGPVGQKCKFCGCTDARPCAGGCAWAEPGLCSTCAKTYHTGELAMAANLIETLEELRGDILDKGALLVELGKTAEVIVHEIARLSANWPDAMVADAKAAIRADAEAIETPSGKGTRSSDSLTVGAAS